MATKMPIEQMASGNPSDSLIMADGVYVINACAAFMRRAPSASLDRTFSSIGVYSFSAAAKVELHSK
jgi:hypothetical protein